MCAEIAINNKFAINKWQSQKVETFFLFLSNKKRKWVVIFQQKNIYSYILKFINYIKFLFSLQIYMKFIIFRIIYCLLYKNILDIGFFIFNAGELINWFN